MERLDEFEGRAIQAALFNSFARGQAQQAQGGPSSTSTASTSIRKRPRNEDEDAKPGIRPSPPPALSEACATGWQRQALNMALSEQVQMRSPILARRLFGLATGWSALDTDVADQPVPAVERWDEGYELYKNGRLLLTRTPGRAAANALNCVELADLLRKESITGCFWHTFLPEHDFFTPYLPIEGTGPHSSRKVPLHVAVDINADPLMPVAIARAGLPERTKRASLTKKEVELVAPHLYDLHRMLSGRNYRASYRYVSGCAHTKLVVVRYPAWILVIITSANSMRCDMELSDNHWFVQSFKKLAAHDRGGPPTDFEVRLLNHMEELGCPTSFLAKLRGKYDFSATDNRVNLVPSTPGVKNSETCDDYGGFRLGAIARQIIPREERHDVQLEFCCGSVGALHTEKSDVWMKRMDRVLRGRNPQRSVEVEVEGSDLPKWRIVFPTSETAKNCDDEVREMASNIGCAIRYNDWTKKASPEVRSMFYDYESKDHGRLFHEKSILWLRPPPPPPAAPAPAPAPAPPPYMAYFGSHNLSQAAWGTPSEGIAAHPRKLSPGANNLELGVVIRGEDLASMLEPGSTWEDIVTYVRPARPYRSGDRAWNSPAWLKPEE